MISQDGATKANRLLEPSLMLRFPSATTSGTLSAIAIIPTKRFATFITLLLMLFLGFIVKHLAFIGLDIGCPPLTCAFRILSCSFSQQQEIVGSAKSGMKQAGLDVAFTVSLEPRL